MISSYNLYPFIKDYECALKSVVMSDVLLGGKLPRDVTGAEQMLGLERHLWRTEELHTKGESAYLYLQPFELGDLSGGRAKSMLSHSWGFWNVMSENFKDIDFAFLF